MRLIRELDPVEVRVLGSLLEKHQATPDAYPLSRNALVLACNQRSNRDPVTDFTEAEVEAALERLRELVLVWKVETSRADRWEHNLEARWELVGGKKAILTLLLLRGEQTPGELRGRSERLHGFPSVEKVERTLQEMAAEPEPLVFELPRRPGQKESRWSHLVGGRPPGTERAEPSRAASDVAAAAGPFTSAVERLETRVAALESGLAALERELKALRERLGDA